MKQIKAIATLAVFFVIGSTASAQFTETFDDVTIPTGWVGSNSAGSTSNSAFWKYLHNAWSPGGGMQGTLDHTGNGGNYAWVDGSYPYAMDVVLETPTLNVAGYVNPEFRFWLKRNNTSASYSGNKLPFLVEFFDGANWNLVYTDTANTVNGAWEQKLVDVSMYTLTGNSQKFKFTVTKGASYQWSYDDIAIDDVDLVSVVANNSGVTAVLNPVLPACTLDSIVIAEIKNFGTANLTSAQINWSINGALQSPYSWTGNLATDVLDTVTVGTNNAIVFGDTILVWTSIPNGVIDPVAMDDTTTFHYIAGLSGTKTIDPMGGGDFISFNDAITSLSTYGVCGNVVIEAVDGNYAEQFELRNYDGMSDSSTVTFTSQSGIADSVIITANGTSSSDNYVVRVFAGSNFVFSNITMENIGTSYSHVMHLWNTNNIVVDNCKLISNATSYNAYPFYAYYYNNGQYGQNNNLTFTNNITIGGNYSFNFYNQSSNPGQNAVIENNEFLDARSRGVYIYYTKNLNFNNNHVTSSSTYSSSYFGYFYKVVGGSISGNHFEGTNAWPRYGVYFSALEGDLSSNMPVTNNRVYSPAPASQYAMNISGNMFVDYSFNSIYKNVSGTGSNKGMNISNGGYNTFFNNNIQITKDDTLIHGTAMFVASGSPIYKSDYNNLSAGSAGNIGGTWYTTVADWTAATGYDSNSIYIENVFSDTSSLKVCADSLFETGFSLAGVTEDYEGDLRHTTPCIGADEFLPIGMFGFDVDPVVCDDQTITLRQDYFDVVVWDTVDTSNVLIVSSAGSHSVAVYDLCGSDTSAFTVLAQEHANVNDTNLCEGTTATLATGISGATYLWSNGSTDSTIMVDSAQIITVQVLDIFGCSSLDTAYVTQSYNVEMPALDSFCTGLNTVLTANITGTYVWSTGSNSSFITVNTPGNYSVTVTDLNCESNATTTVIEKINVVPSFTDSSSYNTVVFKNTTIYADSYSWDFGDGTTSTMEHPIHIYAYTGNEVDEYTVILTATNFCGDVDFVQEGVRAGTLVSVSEIDLASTINVYPNPNNGVFNVTVRTEDAAELSIEVLDVRGSLVYSNTFGMVNGEVNRAINLEGAAQGIYFVKVKLNGETAIYRLAVK